MGSFLAAFIEAGITDVCGIDLPPRDVSLLQFPSAQFVAHDLTQPFAPQRRFDLAISLEVAEHLPLVSAESFVSTLTQFSDIVVFSAAVPRQGGWEHLNEQWQDWWAERFRQRGYVAIDSLRDRVWKNESIPFYYCQNTLMYAKADVVQADPKLASLYQRTQQNSLARVHPVAYVEKSDPSRVTLRFALQSLPHLPGAGWRAIRRRLRF